MELLAIIRRMDTDGDAILLYSEWADFLRPAFPAPRQEYPSPARASSAARHTHSSPLKSRSPMRSTSANRTTGRFTSPVRGTGVSPSRTSPSRKPILRIYDEDELIHGLKDACN